MHKRHPVWQELLWHIDRRLAGWPLLRSVGDHFLKAMTEAGRTPGQRGALTRKDLLPITILLLVGSAAFVRLLALPPFEDEGTELRWIWRVIEAGEWLQPLADGKPLQVWPMVPFVWLGLPPLGVIRAVNVLVGMVGSVLLYRLALCTTENRTTAFVSGALFAICPFVIYLQRLAVAETFLCVAGIWVLINVIEFLAEPTSTRASLLAASLVLAAFCKFPVGFVFVLALPAALLSMPAETRAALLEKSARTQMLIALTPVLTVAIAVIGTVLVQLYLGRAPGFGMTILLGVGFGQFTDIAKTFGVPGVYLTTELAAQFSWPVLIIAAIGIVAGTVLGDWRERWLIAMGLFPMLCLGAFATFWYPRYLLFTLPPLIIAAVSGWRALATRLQRFTIAIEVTVLAICAAFMGKQSTLLIADPISARWSKIDRVQYFEGWGSGYGYSDAAQFILAASNAPPTIFSLDGHGAYQLKTFLPREWKDRVRPAFYATDGDVLRTPEQQLNNVIDASPTWALVSEELLGSYLDSTFGSSRALLQLRLIRRFERPGTRSKLALYEVTPKTEPVGR
jgi:hypothetical protein